MSHATWRTRATRGAGVPEEKLRLVSDTRVEVRLLMDGLASLKLTLRKIVSVRDRDGYMVGQEQLLLTCRACTEEIYHTDEQITLEDLSAARSAGQLHLSECTSKTEADTEEGEEPPAGQAPAITTPEQPPRTYCD